MQFYNLLTILSVVSASTEVFSRAGAGADAAVNSAIRAVENGGNAVKTTFVNAGSSIKNTAAKAGPVLGNAAKATGNVAKVGVTHLVTGAVMGVGLASGFVAVDEVQRRRRNRVDAHLLQ
jgi:2-keto-3-deoxy-6-phosphogluconate aldolase